MQYLGGKVRIAKQLAQVILEHTPGLRGRYIEPFVGGAAVTVHLAPHFQETYASDNHKSLIMMYQALQQGWEPPEYVSEEKYRELQHAEDSPLRAFAGFGCSYSGKFFGGYARNAVDFNYAGAARRALLRDFMKLKNVTFRCVNYETIAVQRGDVVYLDPPYANTTKYTTGDFMSGKFWGWVKGAALRGARVFVSEYKAPDGFIKVWEKKITRGMRGGPHNSRKEKVIERLFCYCDF